MNIRCAIVDDEYLAREYLKDYAEQGSFSGADGRYSPLKVLDLVKIGEIDLIFRFTGLDFLKIQAVWKENQNCFLLSVPMRISINAFFEFKTVFNKRDQQ